MREKTFSIAIMFVFLSLVFSACNDLNLDEVTQFSITTFNVNSSIINEGETANISWVVMSAQTVSIDHDMDNVATSGIRIIQPSETTTYTLTATNGSKTLTATTQIIVKKNLDNSSEDGQSGLQLKNI